MRDSGLCQKRLRHPTFMSYRRHRHSSADAGIPLGSMPSELGGQDQVVGLFVAGPIGALVGRVLAANIKNAGIGTISALDINALAPKPKPSAASSGATKKSKPKPAAGADAESAGEKFPARKRRKRRRP